MTLTFSRASVFRTVRILLALGIIATITIVFWRRTTQVANRNAYVNGSLIVVRARIDGMLTLDNLRPGQSLEDGSEIGKIENTKTHDLEMRQRTVLNRILSEETTFAALDRKLDRQQVLLKQYFEKAQFQATLDATFADQRVKQARHELKAAEHYLEYARQAHERLTFLRKSSAVAEAEFDQVQSQKRQAEETIEARKAALAQAEAQLSAARQGLQLDSAKALNFSELRSESILAEMADIHLQKASHQILLQQAKEELTQITRQLDQVKSIPLTVPKRGVVWAVKASSGEYVREGDPIIQILDVERLWVETFVDEEDCWKLYVGAPAQVRLIGTPDKRTWPAVVEAVRSGVGRTQVGELLAVPPPASVRREVAVRLEIPYDRQTSPLPSEHFLGVGRTAEVEFDVVATP